MAAADSSSSANNGINDIETNPNSHPDSSKAVVAVPNSFKSLTAVPFVHPGVCLWQFAADAFGGGVMGSIFGYGAGLFKKKGLRGSLGEAGTHAKSFAVLSGVHSLVICFLKRVRGKDDVINAGVAGCCTGLALSFPGTPSTLLTSCISFGAFSFIMEGLNKQQPAMAHSLSVQNRSGQLVVPPSLALPLPDELKDAFSSFCQTLRKPNKNGVHTTAH